MQLIYSCKKHEGNGEFAGLEFFFFKDPDFMIIPAKVCKVDKSNHDFLPAESGWWFRILFISTPDPWGFMIQFDDISSEFLASLNRW